MNTTDPIIGPMIAASARLGISYARRLLDGIPKDQFATYARTTLGTTLGTTQGTIESNHPAFVCGHLSLYAPRILSELGQDPTAIAVPDAYESLFSYKATCQDDPQCETYPGAEELIGHLMAGYTAVADALDQTDDGVFQVENPHEPMRGKFPTLGSAHAFYVSGHFMMHMGQLSAWRRAIGLGAA